MIIFSSQIIQIQMSDALNTLILSDPSPSKILDPLKPIQHIIYKEGRTPSTWDGNKTKATYEDVLNVLPGTEYSIKVEVLRNDLGQEAEKVSRITLNGRNIGDCNPDEEDYDCTFFDCSQTISTKSISFTNRSIVASLTYEGHSWDCDCDKETWECAKEDTKTRPKHFFDPMLAVAKITLTPSSGN